MFFSKAGSKLETPRAKESLSSLRICVFYSPDLQYVQKQILPEMLGTKA